MTRRLASVSLAALALAGAVAVLVPQHAASLALLAAGTVAVVSAVFVLVLAAPSVTAEPPVTALDVAPGPGAPTLDPQGLRDARRDLTARCDRGSLPAAVHDRLVRAGVLDGVGPAARPSSAATADPVGAARLVHRLLDEHRLTAPHGGPR